MPKVVKYACMLCRYNYTHDLLNTRPFVIIFRNFFRGGGAQNLSLPPGASYPRYATGLKLPKSVTIKFNFNQVIRLSLQ